MFNIKKYLILLCFFAATLQFTTVSASDSDDEDRLTDRFAGVSLTAASDDEHKGSDSEDEEKTIDLSFTVMSSPTPGFSDKISVSFLGRWEGFEERNPGKSRAEGYQYMIDELPGEIRKTIREHNHVRHFDGFSINYSYLDERLLNDLGRILSTCRIANPTINFHQCTFSRWGLLGYLKDQYGLPNPTKQKCEYINASGERKPIKDPKPKKK